MASYIYMQNLNEILQDIFSILYGKIKKLKLNINLLYMGNMTHLEYQLQPHAKCELNPSTHFRDTV